MDVSKMGPDKADALFGTDRHERNLKQSALKMITVVLLMYCYISSGAYGLEGMVSEAGPGMAILLLILIPIFWGGPFGLISAELSSVFPKEGGIYVWVRNVFGEFWGYNCGWWYTIMGFVDTALYLVLAVSYIEAFIDMSFPARTLLVIGLAFLFAYINIKGIDVIGNSTVVMAIIIMIPFIVLTVMGFAQWQHNPVMPFYNSEAGTAGSFGLALSIGIWMYSGYEAISTMSEEIKDAESVIPKGMKIVMPLVTLMYILPTIAGLAAVGRWEEWSADEGLSFVEIGGLVGGTPLMVLFVIGAVVSNFAIYSDYLASSSRVPFVMAEDRLFPKFFVRIHPKLGTPHISICTMAVITAVLTIIGSFEGLLTVDIFLYMFCLILMFLAALKLRIKLPDLERPYKIPVGNRGFALIALLPVGIAILTAFTSGMGAIVGGTLGLISGPISYFLYKEMYGGIVREKFTERLSAREKLLSFAVPLFGVAAYFREKVRDAEAAASAARMTVLGTIAWIFVIGVIFWGVFGNLLELLADY